MKRFFSTKLTKESSVLTLLSDEFHHLKNVMRLMAGERVEIINGTGLLATAVIENIERHSAELTIEGGVKTDTSGESPVNITLLQGLLKGTNDEVITSATVLGAKELRFFTSEFTAAKPAKDEERQREKWFKVEIEAAKQCGRTVVPIIKNPATLQEALEGLEDSFKIALFEDEKEVGLKEHLKKYKTGQSVAVLVGPEGGLSEKDLGTIRAAGFHMVRLGQRRLRSEAAAHAVLSIIEFELGSLGDL